MSASSFIKNVIKNKRDVILDTLFILAQEFYTQTEVGLMERKGGKKKKEEEKEKARKNIRKKDHTTQYINRGKLQKTKKKIFENRKSSDLLIHSKFKILFCWGKIFSFCFVFFFFTFSIFFFFLVFSVFAGFNFTANYIDHNLIICPKTESLKNLV